MKPSLQSSVSPFQLHKQQRGTALLVAMVLIFMMTVMGMSALRESSLEKRMTTNAVHKSIVFQMAESTASQVSENPDNLLQALNGNGALVETMIDTTDRGIQVIGQARLLGQSNASGFSLGNNGGFQSLAFEIRGESRLDEAQVTSNVYQGIVRLVPTQ